ncbi:amidase family protein [Hyphomicrobium sp. CS1GBMeth3]|uniref:amidase n=1 Tax=Hyphomicrobium sp. CS1GBMeth3 TaxID=1892845 RepID=UPI001FCCCE9E|nr:amidase family protein [Hyphomicrobium sp. CS1GBMeth3]
MPRELLAVVRKRVEEVNPKVNALPTLCFERAERAAAELESRPVLKRGRFAGLPWPIKDSYDVAGVRTTYGSLAYADHIAETSDYAVEAIEAAGGIVYAKSNTPEFEAGANTFNEVFGRTLNPFDPTRSAGGSSGGAAVAVATGMAFLAQGSDFACSLRYPAAFCNVVGLRPTAGLVPQGPNALPFQVLSVVGPIARSVADAAFALDGMVRFDARDPLTRSRDGGSYLTAALAPRRPRRAAFSIDLGIAKVDPEVRAIVTRAVERLASEGLRVEEAHPDLSGADRAFRPLRAFQFAALRRDALARVRSKLKPEVVWNIEEGLKLTAADLAAAEEERVRLRQSMLAFLETRCTVITPTAPVAPFPVEQRYVDEIDGHKLSTYLDWLVLGYAATVCGCPAISIPCGRTASGLPIGLQIVGRPYGETELLQTAAWCEAVLGSALSAPVDPVTLA